eukprot:m.375541 g.375541  ORF g.375541 m.375541 type:complete len:118 (+) comp16699_c0_seq1:244-597(+)
MDLAAHPVNVVMPTEVLQKSSFPMTMKVVLKFVSSIGHNETHTACYLSLRGNRVLSLVDVDDSVNRSHNGSLINTTSPATQCRCTSVSARLNTDSPSSTPGAPTPPSVASRKIINER